MKTEYFVKYFPKEDGFHRIVKDDMGRPYDFQQEVEAFLMASDEEKKCKISSGAIWLKDGDVLKEEELMFIYALDVEYSYRNGKQTYKVLVPKEVEDKAFYESYIEQFADDRHIGSQYGWTAQWDDEKIYLDHVKVKCDKCQVYH